MLVLQGLLLLFTSAPSAEPSARSFHDAVRFDDLARVKQLLARDPGLLNRKGKHDRTALHRAARSGSVEVAKFLLEKGANTELADGFRKTALHGAVSNRHAEIVLLLLKSKAKVNVIDYKGLTPLHYAASNRTKPTVKLLLAHGAKIDFRAAVLLDKRQLVADFLKKNPGLLYPRDKDRETPLEWVFNRNQTKMARLLLNQGADPNSQDFYGTSLLSKYASQGRIDLMRILVDAKAAVNGRSKGGSTPLHYAAAGGQLKAAKWLVDHGARVRARDNRGNTPLHYAASGDRSVMVRWLVNKRVAVDVRNDFNETPLHLAAGGGHSVVSVLLYKGAEVNAKTSKLSTPLHRAALSGHVETVRTLVANGADPQAKDKFGFTPGYCAHIAIRRRDRHNHNQKLREIMKFLNFKDGPKPGQGKPSKRPSGMPKR